MSLQSAETNGGAQRGDDFVSLNQSESYTRKLKTKRENEENQVSLKSMRITLIPAKKGK